MQKHAVSTSRWTAAYRQVKGIRGEQVLELDLGGGPRLLAHVGGGSVTFLCMGSHEIVATYVRKNTLGRDLKTAEELGREFRVGHRDPLLPSTRGKRPDRLTPYGPGVAAEWLYFLDKQQVDVCEGIVEAIEEVLLEEATYGVHFILGGPGTGKTSILLQLLRRLTNQVEPGLETWRIGLEVSDRLAEYIEVSTGWRLGSTREIARHSDEADIMLVDDPGNEAHINWLVDEARSTESSTRAIVISFDPLQLRDSISDSDYARLVKRHAANEWRLSTCYRQKRKVGRAALQVANVVAASSPYLVQAKQIDYATARQELTRIANSMTFNNPSGHTVTYPQATLTEWREHLRWVKRQGNSERAWPTILVVVDDTVRLSQPWTDALEVIPHELIALSTVQDAIKGLEYPHVAIVLSRERLEAVQEGFTGSGRRLYDDYRMLRIPFTRARDSVAVFAQK